MAVNYMLQSVDGSTVDTKKQEAVQRLMQPAVVNTPKPVTPVQAPVQTPVKAPITTQPIQPVTSMMSAPVTTNTATANTTNTSLYGNNGVGSWQQQNANEQKLASDPTFVQSELQRTMDVISNRTSAGMDISQQLIYLQKLQGMQNPQHPTDMTPNFMNDLRSSYDSMFAGQQAQLEQMRGNDINAIQKAYQDAVARGEMSVREAEQAFQNQVKEIEKLSYIQHQQTNLNASNRGIGNSQQLLGMQASDSARQNSLNQGAMSERDLQIANIRDRINTLTTQKDLDIANINSSYDNKLLSARAEMDAKYADAMFQFGRDQFNSDRDFAKQKELLNIGQNFDLQKMNVEQRSALERMAQQNGYDLNKMGVEQQYRLAQMTFGNQLDMSKMAQAHKYDMAKMSQNFWNDYDLITHRANTSISQMQKEYEIARDRELAKYTKGTKEYDIAQSQLDAEFQKMMRELQVQGILENPFLPKAVASDGYTFDQYWDDIVNKNKSASRLDRVSKDQAKKDYDKMMQQLALQRYNNLLDTGKP